MTSRRGFSLVEVIVAIAILGIFMLGLAKANFVIARRYYTLSQGTSRDGEIAAQMNELASMPFDSLNGRAGSKSFSSLPWGFTRTIVVTSKSATLDSVMVIFTPTNPAFRPDTEVLERSKVGKNPLKKN